MLFSTGKCFVFPLRQLPRVTSVRAFAVARATSSTWSTFPPDLPKKGWSIMDVDFIRFSYLLEILAGEDSVVHEGGIA